MLDLLRETDRWMAVNKPAGLASVPGRDEPDSVLDQFGKLSERPRIVHRLDKDTSGVLLLAKDRDAQRHLCNQFMKREVSKVYLALVAGSPGMENGEISEPLARHPKNPKVMMVAKNGQPALTRWEVVQRFRELTLLKCMPQTGRTHQIRVHLKCIGLPLAIDPLYHRPPVGQIGAIYLSYFKSDYHLGKHKEERPLIQRLTLHAQEISFLDLGGELIRVECPQPRDFRATINMLTKYARR